MNLDPTMPYLVGILSGALFEAIAWRNGRAMGLWGIGGALIAGIGHATAVPYSAEVTAKHYWLSTAVSLAFVSLSAAALVMLVKHFDRKAGQPSHK
jgi:hypothetical protein